jgi:hypothetical protein
VVGSAGLGKAVLPVALLALGCKADQDAPATVPTDATWEAAPGRVIVTDIDPSIFDRPDAADSAGRDVGGAGGSAEEPRRDAPAGPDRMIFRPGVDASTGGPCSLLKQDCPPGSACYPDRAGNGTCQQPGGIGESGPCFEHQECAAGLLCVDVLGGAPLCQRICDPRAPNSCGRADACKAFPASTVGTCAP